MNNSRLLRFLSVSAMILCAAGALRAQGPAIEAFVSPQALMVGETAQFTIRFQNISQVPNMVGPRVAGLEFSSQASTASSIQIINGRRTQHYDLTWTFRALREGNYTIPARGLRIDGNDLTVPAVSFRVLPPSEESLTRARLVLELPTRDFYVGEAIPATLHLLVRRDLILSTGGSKLPQTSETAFQHTALRNDPDTGLLRYDGIVYQSLTWNFHLIPIRSGSFPVQFTQNIAIQYTDPDARRQSFFNFGRTRTEQITLQSDPSPIVVLPLPTDNRPESFNGAVGQFEVTTQLSNNDMVVGEPVTFTLTISGTGNFDRIPAPEITGWENWRVYPPRASFEPVDESEVDGSKSFEYILLPESPELLTFPEFSYSTFDPVTGEYLTVDFPAREISVAPANESASDATFFAQRQAEGNATAPTAILPLRPHPGRISTARPLWESPVFWSTQGALALLFTAAFVRESRHARRRTDHRWKRLQSHNQNLRKALKAASDAASNNNGEAFFRSARQALQIAISQRSKEPLEPATLSTSDCLQLLERFQQTEQVRQSAASLLERADSHQFAGRSPTTASLDAALGELNSCIQALNTTSRH